MGFKIRACPSSQIQPMDTFMARHDVVVLVVITNDFAKMVLVTESKNEMFYRGISLCCEEYKIEYSSI